ncbi:MAG: hypothetical protein ACLUB0_06945 [Blautia hansenii]
MLIWNVLVANTGDPEKYLRENWYSTSASNQTGYKNEEADKLLDQLAQEFDPEKRKALIIQIQQLIMDDAATVFLAMKPHTCIPPKRCREPPCIPWTITG